MSFPHISTQFIFLSLIVVVAPHPEPASFQTSGKHNPLHFQPRSPQPIDVPRIKIPPEPEPASYGLGANGPGATGPGARGPGPSSSHSDSDDPFGGPHGITNPGPGGQNPPSAAPPKNPGQDPSETSSGQDQGSESTTDDDPTASEGGKPKVSEQPDLDAPQCDDLQILGVDCQDSATTSSVAATPRRTSTPTPTPWAQYHGGAAVTPTGMVANSGLRCYSLQEAVVNGAAGLWILVLLASTLGFRC